MSKVALQSLEGGIMHAFSLANQYVETCPDTIWGSTFGGWKVWQQMAHAFCAIDFFLRPEGAAEGKCPFPADAVNLKVVAENTPARQEVKQYMADMQEMVVKYVAGLDDAALGQKNAAISARFGRDMTHAGTLGLIASHTMYHLGSCDAALRQNGLPGVF